MQIEKGPFDRDLISRRRVTRQRDSFPAKAEACGKFPDKETHHHPNTPNDETNDLQD
jgi:hypothetical protein